MNDCYSLFTITSPTCGTCNWRDRCDEKHMELWELPDNFYQRYKEYLRDNNTSLPEGYLMFMESVLDG